MGFADDVRAFKDKAIKDASDSVNKAVSSLFRNVVGITPSPSFPGVHAKGLLANQWYPAIKSFSSAQGAQTDAYGVDSLNRIVDMLYSNPFYGKDSSVTLTNNMSYAYQAEYVGWQITGAYGMVRKSVMNLKVKYT